MKSLLAGLSPIGSAVSANSRASFVFTRKAEYRVTFRKPSSIASVSARAAADLLTPISAASRTA
jgi:hypothetical protein